MEFLAGAMAADFLGKPTWLWLLFFFIVFALLAFDLGVLNRTSREIGIRESLLLSTFYIAFGLGFGAYVWWWMGAESGMDYLTGFLIEKSLALDNVFVIALIFAYFAIPRRLQYRVLFWGILAAIVLRAIMIGIGTALVVNFAWIMFVFAAFLVFTGIKMLVVADSMPSIEANPVLRFLSRRGRVTHELHGERFFVRLRDEATGKLVTWMTPLMLTLVLVNGADIIFAVDSVPAIFAITQDPFIVYTSNIFAVLGLRALYFALAAAIHRFHYLQYALALVLIFIGGKIVAVEFVGKFPPWVALGVTVVLLLGGVVVSLWKSRNDPPVVAVAPVRE